MTLKITKNYFQTIIASTSSDEGKIKLADMPVSINHTSDLLQMEEDSQRKGKNIQGVYSYLSNKRTCSLIPFKKKVQPTL